MHRDLKPDNIFLHFPKFEQRAEDQYALKDYIRNSDLMRIPFIVKVGDFGLAKVHNIPNEEKKQVSPEEKMLKTMVGTPLFMPP